MRVIGSDELGVALHCNPLPPRPERRGQLWPSTQVGQLDLSVGDKSQDRLLDQWMPHHAGIDHRRLNGAVGSQRRDHDKALFFCTQLGRVFKGRHVLTIRSLSTSEKVIILVNDSQRPRSHCRADNWVSSLLLSCERSGYETTRTCLCEVSAASPRARRRKTELDGPLPGGCAHECFRNLK